MSFFNCNPVLKILQKWMIFTNLKKRSTISLPLAQVLKWTLLPMVAMGQLLLFLTVLLGTFRR